MDKLWGEVMIFWYRVCLWIGGWFVDSWFVCIVEMEWGEL